MDRRNRLWLRLTPGSRSSPPRPQRHAHPHVCTHVHPVPTRRRARTLSSQADTRAQVHPDPPRTPCPPQQTHAQVHPVPTRRCTRAPCPNRRTHASAPCPHMQIHGRKPCPHTGTRTRTRHVHCAIWNISFRAGRPEAGRAVMVTAASVRGSASGAASTSAAGHQHVPRAITEEDRGAARRPATVLDPRSCPGSLAPETHDQCCGLLGGSGERTGQGAPAGRPGGRRVARGGPAYSSVW